MNRPRRATVSLAALALAIVGLSAVAAPALARTPPTPAAAAQAPPTGTLSVCASSGARPVTGAFLFTFAAPASAGGSQTLSVSVGTCSAQVFYPVGTQVIVTEAVPAGDSVESISVSGGGSTIASNNAAAATATIAIGLGQSLLTVKTNGPIHNCVVPYVVGLPSATAAASLHKSSCTLHVARKVYSRSIRAGRVVSQSPRRGTVLATNAPVDVFISRGRKP
jgi:hypothetical protein